MRLFWLTAFAMLAFAANSILARLALGPQQIDPASYSLIRLGSGALVLALLATRNMRIGFGPLLAQGNWISAAALFAYAGAFSFAYLDLTTGTGALILFAMVQATMIGWALWRGDRPLPLEWLGFLVAFAAFVWLVAPGLAAPDPIGAALMTAAGIAWGIYSLRGGKSADPLLATAGNFLRSLPFAIALMLLAISSAHISWPGALLAIASGAVTSGLGYALWYRVLKDLTATRGAIVQLSVPAIAALGGVLLAGEAITLRLAACTILILGGVAIAVLGKARRKPA